MRTLYNKRVLYILIIIFMKKIFWFFALFSLSFLSITAFASSEETSVVTSESSQKMVDVKITDIISDSVKVEWGKVDWYNWYTVYYDTKSSVDNYKYHSAVLMWTWTILKNLTPNTNYYLVIKAFDNHANEILISEEIKFTTANGESSTHWTSNSTKSWDDLQNSSTVYSSQSTPDNNALINNKDYLDSNNSGWVTVGTEQIKKLPRTWPASYIIVALSLVISLALVRLSKMKFNPKK